MKIVATNGVFDVLHPGHIRFLHHCKKHGDYLIVGLNSDESVKKLKGNNRPIFNQDERWEMLLALRDVDEVQLFQDTDCCKFLRDCEPDIWIKAGYRLETLNPDEVATAKEIGAEIVCVDLMSKWSTTYILSQFTKPIERDYSK